MPGEDLFQQYLPYVKQIAHRFMAHLPNSVAVEDLYHAGVIGLMEAMERFDPSRQHQFITYATYRIKGAILGELRSRDCLSRRHRKQIKEYRNAADNLERKLGRHPTDEELASALGMETETFYETKRLSGFSLVSLSELETGDDEKRTLLEKLRSGGEIGPLDLTAMKELRTALAEAVETLPEKEKLLISLYYWDELTMKEIGAVLGVGESRVSQLHSKAVAALRAVLKRKGFLKS